MAGHSKWANIKRHKGAVDAKRGKLFTKLIREITTSAKISSDIAANPRLRAAVDKALSYNMTRDTIDRAIKRASGDAADQNLESIRYEGYGPNGVAVMVDCLTDNRNRTVADVRHAFTKMGGNLGSEGSVNYLFTKVGQIIIPLSVNEEQLFEAAIEAGADDVAKEEENWVVMTPPDTVGVVVDALKQKGFLIEQNEVTMVASTQVALNLEQAQQLIKMVDMLEDLDDVQDVYSNAQITQDIMQALG